MKREKIQLTVNSGVSKEVLLQGTSHPLKEKVGKWYDGYAMLAVQSFCMKEEEVEWRLDDSKSGSDNIHDVPVDDQDPNQRPCKKRYHCHTQHQIQEMEAYCSYTLTLLSPDVLVSFLNFALFLNAINIYFFFLCFALFLKCG